MSKKLIKYYEMMMLIRRAEEKLASIYHLEEIRCPMHLCIGQEAIAVGVCEALEPSDKVFSNHRSHGHFIAKGGSLNALFAELFGKKNGCCGGKGGSMHLLDRSANFMGSTPIVGGTLPIGVGAAWASKLAGLKDVVVVFFGDGCFEEGVVHECLNFSKLHQLPLIFICENNDFSVYTPISCRQPNRPIFKVAEAHGWVSFCGDGNDVDNVFQLTSAALKNISKGFGPQFIELNTYRVREHCGPNFDDALGYRPQTAIKKGLEKCPIELLRTKLASLDEKSAAQIKEIDERVEAQIDAAISFARESPKPDCWENTI